VHYVFRSLPCALQSKTGKDCSKQFPELMVPQLEAQESVLDGEITILTGGKPDFEGVMERYLASERKVASLVHSKPSVYIVWDILWLDGRQVMDRPLLERKKLLDKVLGDKAEVRKIDWVDTEGLALWEAVKEHGLEGMVAKKKNSRYVPGQRSAAWLKIKNYQEATANVFGYSRKDGGVLVGTGARVQSHAIGMSAVDRAALWELLDEYGTEKGENILLPPGIQGKVKFTTWSPRGVMRDCCWVGFLLDRE